MKRILAIMVAWSGAAFLCGCFQEKYVWVERAVSPQFDHSFIRKIAVVEFENRTSDPTAGWAVANRLEELFSNESDYKVMTRRDIKRILQEHNLSVEGLLEPETMKRLGKLAGVDVLVLGTVHVYELEETWLKRLKVARYASVSLTIKAVSTTSGEIVWSKSAANGSFSWKGWVDTDPVVNARECMQKALDEAVAEARALYPHKEKIRKRIE